MLVAEDEDVLAETIARGLRWEGMAVDVALDGAAALDKAAVTAYDVIVLDATCRSSMATRCAGASLKSLFAS